MVSVVPQAARSPRRETWAAYLEHRRELADPEAKSRPAVRQHRLFPSLLEQIEALAEQVEIRNNKPSAFLRQRSFVCGESDTHGEVWG